MYLDIMNTKKRHHQIDDALAMAEEAGVVDNSGFTAEKKVEIKNNLSKVLTDLKLVQDGGKLRKISHISYYYLALYLKDGMQKKIADPSQLEQKSDEALTDYSDRLLKLYVFTQTPDGFYQGVGYVSLGLFIGLFVFAGIWLLLFVITLIKTFLPTIRPKSSFPCNKNAICPMFFSLRYR